MRVFIATSREIGEQCKAWAKGVYPLVDSPDDCDVFISVLYEHLVSEKFLENRRAYNFHPGILPQYKGSGVFSWAIINKEKETGITLHEIDPTIDTGPIIAIRRIPIEAWDTAGSLFHKAEAAIRVMFLEWFLKLVSGNYEATPQVNDGKIYYRKDLEQAKDLTRFVRAFTFEGKESAYYIKNGSKIYITL